MHLTSKFLLSIGFLGMIAPCFAQDPVDGKKPEIRGTEEVINRIVLALKQRPSFRAKLSFDSEHKNLGPLREGQMDLAIAFKKEITIPLNSKKPEDGDVVFGSTNLLMRGNVKLTPSGNFDGRVSFEKDGVPSQLDVYVRYSNLPALQFKFYEIAFKGDGTQEKNPVIKITGDCRLQQLVLDTSLGTKKEMSEAWVEAGCQYEFAYDKKADKYKFKFDYDSLTGQPQRPEAEQASR